MADARWESQVGSILTMESGMDTFPPPAETGAPDGRHMRGVLSAFPTGVVVIASTTSDGSPFGLCIGSFTSVSLDPPLVGFLPARSSTTWPRIAATRRFCVSVLGAHQLELARSFAVSGGDKFAGVGWRAAGSGSPVLDGSVAWIDCDLERVSDAGDHLFVLGRVRELGVEHVGSPLVFHGGAFGMLAQP
jgi:flavin reductase (DIM6/NTAB) family NADH-FMN oxidoreductase RutF